MSVTSANTIRVESFWLDPEDQKSPSPMGMGYGTNSNGTPRLHRRNQNRSDHRSHHRDSYPDELDRSESIPSQRSQHSNGQYRSSRRLSDRNLAAFDGKQREMAKFRIKHALDVMADEPDHSEQHRFNMSDLYALYEKEQKEVVRTREKVDGLRQELKEKNAEIRHFHEEERKWNKSMVEWEREKSNFEASTIELNFKYQREKDQHRQCQQELSEISLSTKKIILERNAMEQKYLKLVSTLKEDGDPLVQQLANLQVDYDDLEESLVRQQNSWRETGNVLEGELDKQRRKTIKAVNELKKYKQRYERVKKENLKLQQKMERVQRELFEVKSQSEIKMAQIKFEANQKLVANTNMINKLMMSSQRNTDLEQLVTKMADHEGQHVNEEILSPGKCSPKEVNEQEEEPEIEFYDDIDEEDEQNVDENQDVEVTPNGDEVQGSSPLHLNLAVNDDGDGRNKSMGVKRVSDSDKVNPSTPSPKRSPREVKSSRRSSVKSESATKPSMSSRSTASTETTESTEKSKSTKASRKKKGKKKKKPSLTAKDSNQSSSSNDSAVLANIRKFNSRQNSAANSVSNKKKRRNSKAKLTRKSIVATKDVAVVGNEKENDPKIKNKKRKRKKSKSENKMSSKVQLSPPSGPPPSIETAENTLIEQELLSPIRKHKSNDVEGMDIASSDMSPIGDLMAVENDHSNINEKDKRKREHQHRHIRSRNSTSLQDVQHSLIFDDGSEPNISDENVSDLSELERTPRTNHTETVQDID